MLPDGRSSSLNARPGPADGSFPPGPFFCASWGRPWHSHAIPRGSRPKGAMLRRSGEPSRRRMAPWPVRNQSSTRALAFAADGVTLFAACHARFPNGEYERADAYLMAWDTVTGEERLRWRFEPGMFVYQGLALSGDSRSVALATIPGVYVCTLPEGSDGGGGVPVGGATRPRTRRGHAQTSAPRRRSCADGEETRGSVPVRRRRSQSSRRSASDPG